MRKNALILGAALVGTASWATAHEFTAALYLEGPQAASRMAETVNGFLLAADERDGHANETSDGHLGGVDVQILPLPRDIGAGIDGLYNARTGAPDVVVLFSQAEDTALPAGAVLVEAGDLPPDTDWQQSAFAMRYQAAYGSAPTRDAAQGYNAARRLDHAIRPLDGLSPTAEFMVAITSTAEGIDW